MLNNTVPSNTSSSEYINQVYIPITFVFSRYNIKLKENLQKNTNQSTLSFDLSIDNLSDYPPTTSSKSSESTELQDYLPTPSNESEEFNEIQQEETNTDQITPLNQFINYNQNEEKFSANDFLCMSANCLFFTRAGLHSAMEMSKIISQNYLGLYWAIGMPSIIVTFSLIGLSIGYSINNSCYKNFK